MGLLNRRLKAAVFVLATAALVPSVAHAQSPADRAIARSRMEEGEARRERGDLRGALRFFEEADAIMKVPTTGLEVGRTQAQLGLLLEARETLARVMKIPARAGEAPAFSAARKEAEQLTNDLATRIPTLAVTIKNADPALPPRVQVDGENIPASAADTPRKVNPGTHLVLVSAGNVERREEVKLSEGEKRVVTIDLDGASAATPVDAPKTSSTESNEREADKPTEKGGSSTTSKVLVYGGFGVGIVGVAVGSVTGLMSFSKVSDVRTKCGGDICPPAYQADVDSAKNLGTFSTVSFIVGGAGIAAGLVGLFVPFGGGEEKPADGEAAAKKHRAVAVQPLVGPSYVGLGGSF